MEKIILSELEHFFTKEFGANKWMDFLEASDYRAVWESTNESKFYTVIDIIIEAADRTSMKTLHFLEKFGNYLALHTTEVINYDPACGDVMSLIEKNEEKIRNLLLFFLSSDTEVELTIKRVSEHKLTIQYEDELFLPGVILGFLKGLTDQCNDKNVEITLNTYSTGLKSKISIRRN